MKLIKISVIALILTCSMQLAKAQVRVGIGVHIGTPVRYVERPYYYDDYDRVVYYDRPVRRYYGRPVYYRTVTTNARFITASMVFAGMVGAMAMGAEDGNIEYINEPCLLQGFFVTFGKY
jgi:hypothetical protein